jgi:hypothetical protein
LQVVELIEGAANASEETTNTLMTRMSKMAEIVFTDFKRNLFWKFNHSPSVANILLLLKY